MAMMTSAAQAGGHGGDPLRVLVIEDEALVALEIELLLTNAGHKVVGVAEDRISAANLVQQVMPRPNLALVDMRLANGASGLQVAADFAVLGIAVLFVTGNCPAERGQGLAVGCLHKPFTEAELLTAVATAEAVLRWAAAASTLAFRAAPLWQRLRRNRQRRPYESGRAVADGGGRVEEFAARVRHEPAEWSALAREAGIRGRRTVAALDIEAPALRRHRCGEYWKCRRRCSQRLVNARSSSGVAGRPGGLGDRNRGHGPLRFRIGRPRLSSRTPRTKPAGDGLERRDVALALLPAGQQANRLSGRQAASGADRRRGGDPLVLEMGIDAVALADGL